MENRDSLRKAVIRAITGVLVPLGIAYAGTTVPSLACDSVHALERIRAEEYPQALKELPNCQTSNNYSKWVGLAYHGLQIADSTVHYLSLARKNKPVDDTLKLCLAEGLFWQKKIREGSRLLDEVKNKQSLAYLRVAATQLEMRNKFGQAIKVHDRILAQEPTASASIFKKAMLLSWMKRLDESIQIYTGLIDSEDVPASMKVNSRIHRAEVIAWKGDFVRALAELDEVLKLDANNIPARLQKGVIHEWRGEFKEAKNIYRDILLIEPENPSGKAKLETLLWVR